MGSDGELDEFEYCSLELNLQVGTRTNEPTEFVLSYSGAILSGHEVTTRVGEISIYVIDLERAIRDGESALDVLDSYDESLAHFCSLVSVKTGFYKPAIQEVAGVDISRLLVLERMMVSPEFRGYGLGLKAIDVACDRLGVGTGCALAALKAYPIQWEGKGGDGSPAFRNDRSKLVNYYTRAGFRSVIGSGLMVRPLDLPWR